MAGWTATAEPSLRVHAPAPGRGFAVRELLHAIRALLPARRANTAPPAPKSLIFALCDEYRQLDLWSAYHAFRLDPGARTWDKLRRRSVAWRREDTVDTLLQRLCPLTGKRTPDPATVELALLATSSFSLGRSKKI